MKNSSFNMEADRQLVERFKRTSDEGTFREIYRRHTPALYLLALRLFAGSEADAQDAVQETWVRACRLLPSFEWRSSLRTWLAGFVINRVREVKRESRHKYERDPIDECSDQLSSKPSEQLDLERGIALLPDGYRHVLILHDVEGYTHQEISAQLNITAGTSKSQLHHARQALREMLSSERGGQ